MLTERPGAHFAQEDDKADLGIVPCRISVPGRWQDWSGCLSRRYCNSSQFDLRFFSRAVGYLELLVRNIYECD